MRLEGKPVAQALDEGTARLCKALREGGTVPQLVILRVGEKQDDLSYERGALARCQEVGVQARSLALPAQTREEELLAQIERLNRDESVHGVLLLRPFPSHIRDEQVRGALAPDKDVDGITDSSLAGVFAGAGRGFAPCTAQACIELLKYYRVELSGRRAVVVGRSLVVGRPAALLLLHENATVTLCHTKTQDLAARCREADILVAAAGRAGVIGADCAAPGQVVLDVGIHVTADGKLQGDVDFAAVAPLVRGITPVPGGVGAVTTSVLASHTAQAARRRGQP